MFVMKVGIISLGCSKNLVDSEMVLGVIKKMNLEIVNDVEDADIIIINTCGFIESAKQEAINTILEMADYKKMGKKLCVIGCLVQRYLEELPSLLPEVDLFIPIKDYFRFGELFSKLVDHTFASSLHFEDRVLTTPSYMAYVRIADGCDNRCHYCAIPLIRGGFHSRSISDIVSEVKLLTDKGVREINLISQDTTRYGTDINTSIVELLKELVKNKDIKMLRLLYLYPEEITRELIQTIKENEVICNYFDVPIQHASNEVLANMNRRDTKENMRELFTYIKKEIPDAILRTTVIVGYPGETRKQFLELRDFIKEIKFDRLGCFMYSKEEDTVAYSLPNQVTKKAKENRYNEIMALQSDISYNQGLGHVGEIHKVIIEELDFETNLYVGRSYAFAPDDIDGYIFVDSKEDLELGSIVSCKIDKADIYNLYGHVVSA